MQSLPLVSVCVLELFKIIGKLDSHYVIYIHVTYQLYSLNQSKVYKYQNTQYFRTVHSYSEANEANTSSK